MTDKLQFTPLHKAHQALGARLVPFAGWEMPVQYTGIIEEHLAVRENAGMFDVSHMGEVLASGPNAFAFVQNLVTNDASKLYDGKAMYTAMCTENGGIIDDLLVYKLSDEQYLLVINASNIEGDFAWMEKNNPMDADLENISDDVALIAVQGPKAFEIVQSITDVDITDLKFYHFEKLGKGKFFDADFAILSHTGYTGEKGLEIYCDAGSAEKIWNALMEAGKDHGLKPAGLGCRDTLRLESGFCLYGNDITTETNTYEGGLGWITKLGKGDFIGSKALAKVKENGPARRLVGFVLDDKGVPRHGYPILNEEGEVIGEVTSGSQSPILGKGVGLGYVANNLEWTKPGSKIKIQVRKRQLAATIQKPPFHK